jgi:hypothetical protein
MPENLFSFTPFGNPLKFVKSKASRGYFLGNFLRMAKHFLILSAKKSLTREMGLVIEFAY